MSAEVIGGDGRIKDRQGVPPQGVAFRVRRTVDTVIGSAWNGPIGFDQKTFDPLGFYDGIAKFQPKIPGYYRVSATCAFSGAPVNTYTPADIALAKNGTLATIGNIGVVTAAASLGFRSDGWLSATVSDLIYLNGTTDYVEVYTYMGTTGISIRGTSGDQTTFSGELVAGALGILPEPWHVIGAAGEPAFQSGWIDAGISTPRFRKLPDGNVQMQGAVRSGLVNGTIFTLPAGYRPSTRQDYGVKLWNGSALVMCTLRVQVDGSVQQGDASATNELWLSVPPWSTG